MLILVLGLKALGCSIIDLTCSSPNLVESIENWSVFGNVETLSDHQYIKFTINRLGSKVKRKRLSNKRWNFKKVNEELFVVTLEFLADTYTQEDIEQEPKKYTDWLMEVIKSA